MGPDLDDLEVPSSSSKLTEVLVFCNCTIYMYRTIQAFSCTLIMNMMMVVHLGQQLKVSLPLISP